MEIDPAVSTGRLAVEDLVVGSLSHVLGFELDAKPDTTVENDTTVARPDEQLQARMSKNQERAHFKESTTLLRGSIAATRRHMRLCCRIRGELEVLETLHFVDDELQLARLAMGFSNKEEMILNL